MYNGAIMPEQIGGPSFFIGRDDDTLISFGSGQPDLPPPREVFDVLKSFSVFKYGLVQGELPLREGLAQEYPGASAEQFVITNGASEAIDVVLRVIAKPGAKVLLPRPYYYSYPYNVTFAGMMPVYCDLDHNGKLDYEAFKTAITGCRAAIINSPSNPTGTVQDIDTLKKIEALCDALGVYIISDEVYKDLIYERENYLLCGRHVITINSFSKTYAMCGVRVGYVYSADTSVIEGIIEMRTHTAMNTSVVGQAMALAALRAPRQYVADQLAIWKGRRDLMYAGMRELGLDLWKPEGAFYVLPKFKDSNRAMHDLYYSYRIITYDGTWFGAPDHLRFSYALDSKRIEEGLRRVGAFLAKEYQSY